MTAMFGGLERRPALAVGPLVGAGPEPYEGLWASSRARPTKQLGLGKLRGWPGQGGGRSGASAALRATGRPS